ncbi:MAG: c-type cytochrome [Acidobacteriota bacterium]
MYKRMLFLTAVAVVALGAGWADQTNKKIVLPVDRTNPTNAKQMYESYCASCHGKDGKGNGPVANELKTAPSDLTLLSRQNNGKFPDVHVAAVLRFGANVPAHGSEEMPVWGKVLGRMDARHSQITELRIANLSHYLESIQEK